jgi:ComF family protein
VAWRAFTNRLLSSLFQPPCAACSAVLRRPLDGAVCDACWGSVRVAPSLHERFNGDHAVDWAAAVGEYDGCLRDIIHALKYEGRRSIAPPLGALMRSAGADLLRGACAVVPVPLHPRRERSRGFNQADDLARTLGVPVRPLLRRIRYTTSQIELPKDERHRNVHEAFEFRSPEPGARSPSVVVLVDDVATTGATLEACAAVLKAAGANEVRALTAARVASARR